MNPNNIVQELIKEECFNVWNNSSGDNSNFDTFGSMRSWRKVLDERESFSFFDKEKDVEYDDLVQMLINNEKFIEQIAGTSLLEQYLLINRVNMHNDEAFSSRKVYRYSYPQNDIQEVADIPQHFTQEQLMLQKEFANAAVVVFFVGKIADRTATCGVTGYTNLLTIAGMVAHNMWLHSLSRGYEGTVFAGLLPRTLRMFTDIDGFTKAQMFAYCFGKR
ncbi:hypothetical protein E8L90_19425 [Brevibacillus antibioticus]|uniref:Uncharacterized protein n=1 Tax=Brevibacillus antibioticus TaxID=2570228 RepID=A0A4U2Y9Q6_9BACL|nr:nitroreductase family protein [Brevibacillus antibioticus]TKI57450.1 hypothetical protein E8L90_19425 [Brevibacillus antibioticus]